MLAVWPFCWGHHAGFLGLCGPPWPLVGEARIPRVWSVGLRCLQWEGSLPSCPPAGHPCTLAQQVGEGWVRGPWRVPASSSRGAGPSACGDPGSKVDSCWPGFLGTLRLEGQEQPGHQATAPVCWAGPGSPWAPGCGAAGRAAPVGDRIPAPPPGGCLCPRPRPPRTFDLVLIDEQSSVAAAARASRLHHEGRPHTLLCVPFSPGGGGGDGAELCWGLQRTLQ